MRFYSKGRFFALIAVLALVLCRSAKASEPTNAVVESNAAVANDAASAPAMQSSAAIPGGGWHFGITPYLWFAGAHGTAGFNGREASFHASFADIISSLNIGIMVAGEARKDRFVFPVDFLWMKLSDDKAFPPSPSPDATSIKAKMTQSILTPKAGYMVVDEEKLKLDGIVGIRYWHMGEDLSLQPSNLSNSQSANWVDVVAGARLRLPFTPKTLVTITGDAGAGGANVDYQVAGLLGYKFKPTIIGQLGWRYLDVNYRSTSTFIYDAATSGILLGMTFNLK